MAREYKDSGIEWIGRIPKEWKTERIKALFSERNERDCQGKTLLSVSQYFGIRPKSETDLADSHIAESYDDYKEVHKGDFVMNIMLAWNGSNAVSDYDGIVSPAYCVFKFRKDCCNKYFHYLLRTNGYPSAFKTMSRGVIDSRLRLYPEQFYTFPVVIPPLAEQNRIADYLDEKCGEIDALIALQEQMITQLTDYKQSVITEAVTKGLDPNATLVPSGVDWIGDVPKGWIVCKLKYLCNYIKDGTHFSPNTITDGYPYITATDVRGLGIDYANAKKVSEEVFLELQKAGCQPHNGDILLVKDGATTGRVGMMIDDTECVLLSSVAMLSPNKRVTNKYLMYVLMSDFMQSQMKLSMAGAALPRITLTKLMNFNCLFSPLSEQYAIVSYLDTKCSEIDTLISLKQQKIETLKDYKKSMIYECVTGKTDIT